LPAPMLTWQPPSETARHTTILALGQFNVKHFDDSCDSIRLQRPRQPQACKHRLRQHQQPGEPANKHTNYIKSILWYEELPRGPATTVALPPATPRNTTLPRHIPSS
jgi:hypothetical protein